jgi:sulfatase modifying factor 1
LIRKRGALASLFALAIVLLIAHVGLTQVPEKIGILLVVRDSDPSWRDAVVGSLIEQRRLAGYPKERLPVMIYHYDLPTEKANAEYLGVHDEELPFAGIVSVGPKGQPVHVLYAVEHGTKKEAVAGTVFSEAQRRIGSSEAAVLATPLPEPGLTFKGVNKQGFREYINDKDGSVLVYVPGGKFQMGLPKGSDDGPKAEIVQDARVAPFYLCKTEITNAQFQRFFQSRLRPTTAEQKHNSNAVTLLPAPRYYRRAYTRLPKATWSNPTGTGTPVQPKHPVTDVSWDDAVAYCKWAGLRLPTEPEWELGARGLKSLKYPWGKDFDARVCRTAYPKVVGVLGAAGSMPAGASPYGLLDMIGNAAEWCSSIYKIVPYSADDGREDLEAVAERAVRGGSIANHRPTACYREGRPQDWSACDLGFRCARSLSAP